MKKFLISACLLLVWGISFAQTTPASPVVNGDEVTFSMYAPMAKEVTVHGSWMDPDDNCYGTPNWTKEIEVVKMKKDKSGVWSCTIPAPAPELWTYNFYVDGVYVLDPANKFVQWDGTRRLSVLLIEGELVENFTGATEHGNIEYVWYDSPTLGQERRMMVYTPHGYRDSGRNYPVLYLLHGGMCDETTWDDMGRATAIIDNRIQKGEAEPMIVVMPNGNPSQNCAPHMLFPNEDRNESLGRERNAYVNSLVNDVIPYVERHYRVIPDKAHRAVSGLSMGGAHTLAVTNAYPDVFDYICPMGCGGHRNDDFIKGIQGIKKAGYKLYWHAAGTADFAYPGAVVLDEILTENEMPHTFYKKDGGHTWSNWRIFLDELLPLLFK